jgi:hypothetical protein
MKISIDIILYAFIALFFAVFIFLCFRKTTEGFITSIICDKVKEAHKQIPKIDENIVDSIRIGLNNIIDNRPDIIDALHKIFSDDGISAAIKKIMSKSGRCA